jgi:hypothetical protein
MEKLFKLNLQLFGGEGAGASGAGEGAGDGATSGENATVDAEQRLRELGVPEDKIRKRASKVASQMPTKSVKTDQVEQKAEETTEQTAPAETPTEENKDVAPTRMSWDEIMKDPEYNKQMQAVVQSRLKSAKGAEEALGKMTPALEVLARKYGLDPANMDYDALAKKINDDDSYYEEKALEMGVSVDTAKKIDQMERNTEREKAQTERTLQEQKIQQHIINLEQQGEAMKKVFPNFDLRKELQNPAFARMTSPNVGISVEDAYYAVHRNEIQTAAMQATAQKTAEKISNAIQSGSRRPDESGASSQAASVSTFNYRNASREQREALKKRIYAAAARGEKLYPGQ